MDNDAMLLLGPGPSNAPKEVLDALSRPLIGHMDPEFLALLDGVNGKLRRLFRAPNHTALPVSATGSAGMEASFANFAEPGETVLIGVNGVFGERMTDVAARCGANVVRVDAPWGEALDTALLAAAAKQARPALVAVVHGETSTGVAQPIEPVAAIAKEVGALFLVDAVTSLAGMPVELEKWGVDICYSGTQKCLNVPPGLSPLAVSRRAVDKLRNRKSKVRSWYLDLTMILKYLEGAQRVYHHTAPISMIFALDAGLDLILAEGLEARHERHRDASACLIERMGALGFEPLVEESVRLWPLTTFQLPAGVDDGARTEMMRRHRIEIGPGLGRFAGRVWRFGLMGVNARREIVDRLIAALRDVLGK